MGREEEERGHMRVKGKIAGNWEKKGDVRKRGTVCPPD